MDSRCCRSKHFIALGKGVDHHTQYPVSISAILSTPPAFIYRYHIHAHVSTLIITREHNNNDNKLDWCYNWFDRSILLIVSLLLFCVFLLFIILLSFVMVFGSIFCLCDDIYWCFVECCVVSVGSLQVAFSCYVRRTCRSTPLNDHSIVINGSLMSNNKS